MLTLGEFNLDNFGGTNATVVWLLFVGATFFSQITILNMLIAIMGDTFDRVQETRQIQAMDEKLKLLNQYSYIAHLFEDKKKVEDEYLFVIT